MKSEEVGETEGGRLRESLRKGENDIISMILSASYHIWNVLAPIWFRLSLNGILLF